MTTEPNPVARLVLAFFNQGRDVEAFHDPDHEDTIAVYYRIRGRREDRHGCMLVAPCGAVVTILTGDGPVQTVLDVGLA